MRPVAGSMFTAIVVGCGGGDPIAEACGGERPSLDACTVGLFHADCGGDGAPTFACSETGQCRWFATRCVPSGHHASECTAGDLCCEVTDDGDWPFADGWTNPIGPFHEEMLADIATLADTTVTPASPANLVLTLDPSVPAGTRTVTCTGDPIGGMALCDRPVLLGVGVGADTFVITVQPSIFGITVLAEVVTSGPEPVARAFIGYQNDYSWLDPPSTCPMSVYDLGPVASGTLTLSSYTDDAHGALSVDVEGGTIRVTF
jgi:hypothetical protein